MVQWQTAWNTPLVSLVVSSSINATKSKPFFVQSKRLLVLKKCRDQVSNTDLMVKTCTSYHRTTTCWLVKYLTYIVYMICAAFWRPTVGPKIGGPRGSPCGPMLRAGPSQGM